MIVDADRANSTAIASLLADLYGNLAGAVRGLTPVCAKVRREMRHRI